jgi:hypothetical protein
MIDGEEIALQERAREIQIQSAIVEFALITRKESWKPRRLLVTAANSMWRRFIERCRLYVLPDVYDNYIWLYGQDGWAFTTAIRFESAAFKLVKPKHKTPTTSDNEDYYWSGYYLMSLLIERARHDMTFLEAIEALAVMHLGHGDASNDQVTRTLQQMDAWPGPPRERP